jgi:exopolysaccharide biosynthesis polyprenyl glycosylphosphotransferase
MRVEAQLREIKQETGKPGAELAFRLALPFSERRALLVLVDALMINGAVMGGLYLWSRVGGGRFAWAFVGAQWLWFPLLTVLWWVVAHLADLYDVATAARQLESLRRVMLAGLSLLVVYLVVYFFLPPGGSPRLFILFFVGLALVGLLLWRWIYTTVFTMPRFRHRVLIAGAGWSGVTIAQVLAEHRGRDYQVVGFVDDDLTKQSGELSGLPVLGGSEDLLGLMRTQRIDEIVVAVTHGVRGELFQSLMDCHAAGVHLIRMPALYERLTRRVPVEHVDQGWVIESLNDFSAWTRPTLGVKRLLDLALGLLGGFALLALLPVLALLIVLDCPGPVFYRQVRSGQGGVPFLVWKLRTMIPNAEGDGQPRWAMTGDDRITRVGRFLRKMRLDELPQVLNVLRGEMSIVGPRPERPEFIAELQEQIPFYRTRLCVKPGLTGWAQIFHGYGSSVEDALVKLQYDLYYIRHWSLWMDLYVILRTVGVVLRFKGT